jgi:Zn ribbon nucleic-acid-binding protein
MHGAKRVLDRQLKYMAVRQCPTCREDMRLTLIQPGTNGIELQTFECVWCGHEETVSGEIQIT